MIPVTPGIAAMCALLAAIIGGGLVLLGMLVMGHLRTQRVHIVATRTQPLREQAQGFVYRNYRGETRRRILVPYVLWYGETEWHPEPQWLLQALDVEKNEIRDFALSGFCADTKD